MKTMALHNVVFLRTEFVEFLAPSALVLLLMVPFSRLTERPTCTLIALRLQFWLGSIPLTPDGSRPIIHGETRKLIL